MKQKITKLIIGVITSVIVAVIYRLFRDTLNKVNWFEYLYFVLIAVGVFFLLSLLDRKGKR
ncbi:hypothetical protein ACE41H_12795 [Paenibacillus enshidis]|uniref:Uncharacterized protein n=1 Tax=Paenibacillus enshidis TaxID=1458439 RepID=A0ABV5ATX1_9BACL